MQRVPDPVACAAWICAGDRTAGLGRCYWSDHTHSGWRGYLDLWVEGEGRRRWGVVVVEQFCCGRRGRRGEGGVDYCMVTTTGPTDISSPPLSHNNQLLLYSAPRSARHLYLRHVFHSPFITLSREQPTRTYAHSIQLATQPRVCTCWPGARVMAYFCAGSISIRPACSRRMKRPAVTLWTLTACMFQLGRHERGRLALQER